MFEFDLFVAMAIRRTAAQGPTAYPTLMYDFPMSTLIDDRVEDSRSLWVQRCLRVPRTGCYTRTSGLITFLKRVLVRALAIERDMRSKSMLRMKVVVESKSRRRTRRRVGRRVITSSAMMISAVCR